MRLPRPGEASASPDPGVVLHLPEPLAGADDHPHLVIRPVGIDLLPDDHLVHVFVETPALNREAQATVLADRASRAEMKRIKVSCGLSHF